MPEAVIVATGRSPIGRADKGLLLGVGCSHVVATHDLVIRRRLRVSALFL